MKINIRLSEIEKLNILIVLILLALGALCALVWVIAGWVSGVLVTGYVVVQAIYVLVKE